MPFYINFYQNDSRHVGKWLIQIVFSGVAYYTRFAKLQPTKA
jgi:hypothetical protein